MNEKNQSLSRKELWIFLAIAYGCPYLMGIPMYFGLSAGADVTAFPLAQMLYPAAGVMLAFLVTRRKDPMLPRGFYGFYLFVTAAMLVCCLCSVLMPGADWLSISNYAVIAASLIGWVILLATRREKCAAYELGWRKGSTSGVWLCTLIFAGLYVLRIFLPAFLTGTQSPYLEYLLTPMPYIMLLNVVLNFFLSFLCFFGEEYGWRYFLQPRMQAKFGTRKGVILLGVVWGLWHLPLNLFYYAPDTPLQSILLQQITCICLGIVIAYGYLRTGNIWTAVIMHFLNNNMGLIFVPDLSFQNQAYGWGDVLYSLILMGVLHLPFLFSRVFNGKKPEPPQAQATNAPTDGQL